MFTSPSRERGLARRMIEALEIQTRDENTLLSTLSGGNQQKVVLGKWLACDPTVLLLDEPTRGVDVGAKEEIYRLMEENAAKANGFSGDRYHFLDQMWTRKLKRLGIRH